MDHIRSLVKTPLIVEDVEMKNCKLLVALIIVCLTCFLACGDSSKVSELEKKASDAESKVAALEEKVAELEKTAAPTGKTLEAVQKKGFIQVGVNGDLFGFGKPDEKGVWKGLDVDTGRAIAAAVFGDANKVKYTPLTAVTRFTALQSGEIDVLCRNATRTLSRETALGLNFVQVNYYDGQGFLVPKALGVKSASELDGAAVCVLPGTTTELNVADYFRSNGMKMNPVVIENTAELAKAFFAGRCDCLTSDVF